jgi:site-specific DNA recombinase
VRAAFVEGTVVRLIIPTTQASYGHEPRLRLEPPGHHDTPRDERLVELVARAFAARDELLEMDSDGVAAMPVTRLRHLQRTARMSYLDPAIIRSILNGTQPRHLSARTLWRMADLPIGWAAQRQALQFPTT